VFRLLRYFTLLSDEQVQEIEKQHQHRPDSQLAQKILAEEVTELVHGPEASKKVKTMVQVLFDQILESLTTNDVKDAFENSSRLIYSDRELLEKDIVSVLVETGVCISKCTIF
jgi:tyrosyl-tRNA synthetase